MPRNNNLYSETFRIYGNLMFYGGHQPDYFYFSSLLSYNSPEPAYNQMATEVAMKGAAALAKPPDFRKNPDTDEMPALKHLETALDFLREAVKYERANEIEYFKQKFILLKDNFKDEIDTIAELTDLANLFEHGMDEGFDYAKMIALINILENGLKEAKTIATFEANRIKTIDEQMDQLYQSRRNQIDGLWKKMNGLGKNDIINKNDENYINFVKKSNKRFSNRVEVQYMTHGNLSSSKDEAKRKRVWGAKKYLKSVPETVDVQVAHWITDHITEIFNSDKYMKEFEQLAQQYVNTGVANTSTVREMLVKSITDDGVKHVEEILKGTYKNLPTDQFINKLQGSIEETRQYKIKGYYSNFGQYGKSPKYFNGSTLKSGLEAADGLYEAYKSFRDEITKKNHTMTKEETYFYAAMKQQKHLQTYSRIISLVQRLERKQHEFEQIQKDIAEGRRYQTDQYTTRKLKLGSNGENKDIVITVKITADGIEYGGAGELQAGINKTSLIKSIGNGRTEATTIKGIINGLKSKMSRSIRNDLSNAIASIAASPKNKRTTAQITTAFEKALTGLKLSVGGPKLSEISPAITNALQKGILTTHFPDKINRRNDLITISLMYNDIHLKTTLEDIVNTRAKELVEKLDPQLQNIQKQYIRSFEDDFYDKMSKLKNTDANFNSLAENERIWFEYQKKSAEKLQVIQKIGEKTNDLWEDYVEKARKHGDSEEQINEARLKILSSLGDSFYISDTMKTYNQYQNNLGFSGASLGASVSAQLDNLNTLFEKAGAKISKEDLGWLEGAIINCSPVSMFGEKNKNLIENYLSSMAALAMFDEGSAEAQIISDLQHKIETSAKSNPKILHLYRVNGIFVPGSVVLERTIEDLSKCLEVGVRSLDISLTNHGAGIQIVNTMNEGLIPNRKTTQKHNNTDTIPWETDPWGHVASKTKSHVKLKIMFLAGLLDIINSMNKYMGNVELPK